MNKKFAILATLTLSNAFLTLNSMDDYSGGPTTPTAATAGPGSRQTRAIPVTPPRTRTTTRSSVKRKCVDTDFYQDQTTYSSSSSSSTSSSSSSSSSSSTTCNSLDNSSAKRRRVSGTTQEPENTNPNLISPSTPPRAPTTPTAAPTTPTRTPGTTTTSTELLRTPTHMGTFTRNVNKLRKRLLQVSPASQKALSREAKILTPFLVTMYTQQFTTSNPNNVSPLRQADRNTKKKRRGEIPKAKIRQLRFDAQPAEEWSATINAPYGYTVNQRDSLINPLQVDSDGRLNLHRMLDGHAPIGRDNSIINLHHWLRLDPGPLGEISGTLHRRESGVLHFNTQGVGPDRPEFNAFRRLYWQARAYDMLEKVLL